MGEDWCRNVKIPSRFKKERKAEDSDNTTNAEANVEDAKIAHDEQEVPQDTPVPQEDSVVQDIINFEEKFG